MSANQIETQQMHLSPPSDHEPHSGPPAKRQKKEDQERKRVSRACDSCKKKKTRCSGRQPCVLCTRNGLSCDFTALYTRGRLPVVLPDESNLPRGTIDLGTGNDSNSPVQSSATFGLEQAPDHYLEPRMQTINPPVGLPLATTQLPVMTERSQLHLPAIDRLGTDSRVQSSRNSPDPSQTDLQGHYVGPSSGVSFLLRVQKKLHEKLSFSQNSSIFTFGDAPLPEFDPSYFVLPPKADAEVLVARYFDFAMVTHRFLHRPTIEAWLEEFYDNLGVMRHKEGAKGRIALLFMVFAQAKNYMPLTKGNDTSARYFQAADHQLSSETGEIRLTIVQTRLCQCFYLLSQSRVNHCWGLFGTTAHLILALGIHRKRRMETSTGADLIELECRKRVFWSAYGLDSYLSSSLGRPRTFHDDDIDQELPNCVNDSDLTSQRILPNHSKAQSAMLGSIAHNNLSKILNHILRDLYAIRSPSLETRIILSAKYSGELFEWRKGLAKFLDADGMDTSMLIPLFQRQRNVLNLAYHHALILVYRPFLLSNFASLSSHNHSTLGSNDSNVARCLEAAVNIAAIVNELSEGGQIFRAFWFTHYFAFCAIVVLYVYTIQQKRSSQDTYRKYFETAEKCQGQISLIAENESLAQRYSVVLEELRLEALKQIQQYPVQQQQQQQQQQHRDSNVGLTMQSGFTPQNSMQLSPDQNGYSHAGDMFTGSDANMFGEGPSATTPSSLMAELTSWGEFDSLVTAGIGGLDFMFLGDQSINRWDGGASAVGYNGQLLS